MVDSTSTLGIVLGFASVCVTQIVIWLNGRNRQLRIDDTVARTEQALEQVSMNADTAATEAASAAQRIMPVANGFTAKVLNALADLKSGQTKLDDELIEVHRKLDRHIGDHASADVLRRNGVPHNDYET